MKPRCISVSDVRGKIMCFIRSIIIGIGSAGVLGSRNPPVGKSPNPIEKRSISNCAIKKLGNEKRDTDIIVINLSNKERGLFAACIPITIPNIVIIMYVETARIIVAGSLCKNKSATPVLYI